MIPFFNGAASNSISMTDFPDVGLWRCNQCQQWSIEGDYELHADCPLGGEFIPLIPVRKKRKNRVKKIKRKNLKG